jgi:hypothetical protein
MLVGLALCAFTDVSLNDHANHLEYYVAFLRSDLMRYLRFPPAPAAPKAAFFFCH